MATPQSATTTTVPPRLNVYRDPFGRRNECATANTPSKQESAEKERTAKANTNTPTATTTAASTIKRQKGSKHKGTKENVKKEQNKTGAYTAETGDMIWNRNRNRSQEDPARLEYKEENDAKLRVKDNDGNAQNTKQLANWQLQQHHQTNTLPKSIPSLSFCDILSSIELLSNSVYTAYRAQKQEAIPQAQLPKLRLPRVRITTTGSDSHSDSAVPRFQGRHLLSDESPQSYLFSNDFLPLQAKQWARNFTKGCIWMSTGSYQECSKEERHQSLYCFPVDMNSAVERRLAKGGPGIWELSSVLIGPAPAATTTSTSTSALPMSQEPTNGHMLHGGIIYHKGVPTDGGGGTSTSQVEGDAFLVGDLRCALTIIIYHLRFRQTLLATKIDPAQYTKNFFVRIVSITASHLRVLDVRYDPISTSASCHILISIDLFAEGGDIKKQQRLNSDWARAIAITVGLKEKGGSTR
ncbi:hypothetical protein DL98DRAFT_596931 [Cadophora sp. DSE1049]|nr:hypothetical protein DL98DRAFT_596931 [Cadophora sp. DSE1049]